MIEKIFRIVSNSEEHLTAENIAMALTKQITFNPKEPNAAFAVMELSGEYSSICKVGGE